MPKEREMSTAEKIYHMLLTEEFEHWFRNAFMDHMENARGSKIKDIIIDDIQNMLGS